MSRIARVVVPGTPHHLTHRGNRGEEIFHSPVDRFAYIDLLRAHGDRCGLEFWAYCLMSNHVHLIALPRWGDSMAEALREAHGNYAKWFNARYGYRGHLWANRYYSAALGETHLFRAARYVEMNPVRAGLAMTALDYPWSSARAHCTRTRDPLLAPGDPLSRDAAGWLRFLREGGDARDDEIRRRTRAGRPIGDRRFLAKVRCQLGRDLEERPPGRPRRAGHRTPA